MFLLLLACGSRPIAAGSADYERFVEFCASRPKIRALPHISEICECIGEGFVVGKTVEDFNQAQVGEGPHVAEYQAVLERCTRATY
ncbi:MAG: hypothetical protein R3F61_24445 [Myxococcota bacterium]